MKKPLRLLLVEDSDLDAAHLLLELQRAGFEPNVTRVETAEEFQRALGSRETWDLIISEYDLPQFSAPEANRRRAENLFRAVLRASPLPAIVVDRTTATAVDGSDSFRRQFLDGRAGEGQGLFDLVHFTHPERIEQLLARGSGTAWYAVYQLAGVARMANVRCYSVEHDGASYAYLILEDVTEQHYLKAAFDAVTDPLLIISSQNKVLYGNRAAEELFGNLYFGADVTPLLTATADRWWTRLDRHDVRRVELAGRPFDATAVPFRFAGEAETSTILTLHDVAAEEELRRLATHDALTGIFNLRHFESVLVDHIREGGTLVLLDLDHFKPINDELGHAAGDRALTAFAAMVRDALRPADVFARIGGDEFAVFFPRTPAMDAVQVVEAIYARLARSPFVYDGTTRPFSASSGLTAVHADDSPETLRRRADEALYEAKRQGRGRWVVA